MDQPFRKRIILSDDINRALSQIDCYLHRGGYDVRVGRTGEEILSLARREPATSLPAQLVGTSYRSGTPPEH